MKTYLLLLLLFFIADNLEAQEKGVIIEVKDKVSNSAVQYYSLNDGKNWLFGDSTGKTIITPYFFNKPLKLSCLSYPDTTIIISNHLDYKLITLQANNLLDEVVVNPNYSLEKKTNKIQNNEKLFKSVGYIYTSKIYGRPVEYGQVCEFKNLIFLSSVSFKARTNYPTDRPLALLHIYQLSKENVPIPLSVKLLNKIKPSTRDGFFTFDLSSEKIYLNSGKYIFSLELILNKNTTEKISIPFNLTKTKSSMQNTINKRGERIWIDAKHNNQFMQLVTTIKYQNVL